MWYSEEGTGLATAHPSMASVPITVLLYNSPLLCSFDVGIKGLNQVSKTFGEPR